MEYPANGNKFLIVQEGDTSIYQLYLDTFMKRIKKNINLSVKTVASI